MAETSYIFNEVKLHKLSHIVGSYIYIKITEMTVQLWSLCDVTLTCQRCPCLKIIIGATDPKILSY